MRRILQLLLLCTFCLWVSAWSKEDYEIFKLRDEVAASEGSDTTFYRFLGVESTATLDEISKALKKKSRALHPDKAKHTFITSRSTPRPKKPGDKKSGTHVSKGPSEREIARFLKTANARYSRLGVVANILKEPETRSRYDYFLNHGFPTWRGTGYYYSRYRPGLGTVLLGLFMVGGGAVHYFILISTWSRQRAFLERYVKSARATAWGDESTIGGLPGLGDPVDAAPPTQDEPESMANLNRRQKRELERQQKKDKTGKTRSTKPAPTAVPSVEKRKIQAENGKILVVDRTGNVYLEEEDEDGNVQEYLLDLDDLPAKPTIWDTAVVRLPIWLYHKCADSFLNSTKPIPEVEMPKAGAEPTPEPTQSIVVPSEKPIDMSSSQISDFEIVDSTGIEKEIEKGSDSAGMKKRGKKSKK